MMRLRYIDIHSHLLPGLDDGPKTMTETIALARAYADDGAAGVIATPHVALGSDISKFLTRRDSALKAVRQALETEKIKLDIKKGAEIMISQCDEPALAFLAVEMNARELCLADSNLILVEFPEGPEPLWYEKSIFRLQQMSLQPVVAHVERYTWLRQKNRLAALAEMGLYFQINCECLNGFFRPVKRLMKAAARTRLIHFIATDAHDTENRRPRLGAIDLKDFYWQMENAKALFKHTENNVFYTS